MKNKILHRVKIGGALIVMTSTLFVSLTATSERVGAAPGDRCKVVLSLDISGTMESDLDPFKDQIRSVFSGGVGLGDRDDIDVALWTFSHTETAADMNPDFIDYVPTNAQVGSGDYSRLDSGLKGIDFRGGFTNYAQGFGYNATRPAGSFINSNFTLNQSSNSGVRRTMNSRPDLFILLTDGQPNRPATFVNSIDPNAPDYMLNGNPAAKRAGIEARSQYTSDTNFSGGFINVSSSNDTSVLAEVINGNASLPAPNIGQVSVDSSLGNFIVKQIRDACEDVSSPYNLTPSVNNANGGVVVGDVAPRFDYTITNGPQNPGSSNWEITDVVLRPGATLPYLSASVNGIANICNDVRAKVGNANVRECRQPSADDGANDGRVNNVAPNRTVSVKDNAVAKFDSGWELGTKICRVLKLISPAPGVSNRVHGACAIIGKPPLLQVQGGDTRVGRQFKNETVSSAGLTSGVYTSRFELKGAATLTFGSWVEYGVMAPGVIKNTASLAAYNGGYDGPMSSGDCTFAVSSLTFANTPVCGKYGGSSGSLMDVESKFALKNGSSATLSPLNITAGGDEEKYYYENATKLEITGGSIGSGTQRYVYAPKATVIITGDITYANGAYKAGELGKIPQVVIVAKNIGIAPSVGRVDAWLVAEGKMDDEGIVNTCVDSNGVTLSRAFIAGSCRKELVVNGPVVARELRPWRSTVWRDGKCDVPADYKTNGGCTRVVDKPAEIFNLPGSTVLWALKQMTEANGVRSGYTTELPPIY